MITGIDTSRHTDDPLTIKTVDWQKCKAAGCRFVIMRASIGLSKDSVFDLHKRALEGLLPRGSYHYYRTPAADPTWSIINQVSLYHAVVGKLEIPPVMDVEDWYGELPKDLALINTVCNFLDECDQQFNQEAILYTSPNIIQHYLHLSSHLDLEKVQRLLKRQLWIAHYGVSKPEISPWTDYLFWQFSETVDANGNNGTHYGFNESKDLDCNYCSLAEDQFVTFTNMISAPIPVENDGIKYARVTKDGINIRTIPGVLTSDNQIGVLRKGAKVKVTKRADGWVHYEACSAENNNNGTLLEIIE